VVAPRNGEPCRWMCCLEEELQTLYDLRKGAPYH
jgi:hypothetical protein